MFDLKLDENGDLEISPSGDLMTTESVCQAVRVRLKWFLGEWRLGPDLGFGYFEHVLVKNPSYAYIKHLVRQEVMKVKEVQKVDDVSLSVDHKTRRSAIDVTFSTNEDTFREEVNIEWPSMA